MACGFSPASDLPTASTAQALICASSSSLRRLVDGVEGGLQLLVAGLERFVVMAAERIDLALQRQDLRGRLGLEFDEVGDPGAVGDRRGVGAGFGREEQGGDGEDREQRHQRDARARQHVLQTEMADIEGRGEEHGRQQHRGDREALRHQAHHAAGCAFGRAFVGFGGCHISLLTRYKRAGPDRRRKSGRPRTEADVRTRRLKGI